LKRKSKNNIKIKSALGEGSYNNMRISNIYKRKKKIKPSIKVRKNSTIISFKMPVKSPELNLIEVEDGHDGYKDGINNSTFKDEQEIGKVISKWKDTYNKNHVRGVIANILQGVYLCVYTTVNLRAKENKIRIK